MSARFLRFGREEDADTVKETSRVDIQQRPEQPGVGVGHGEGGGAAEGGAHCPNKASRRTEEEE